jgi:sulfite reductase beta subunit-like hemoprotein
MREIEAVLGGKDVTLAATFKASKKIADQIADPLLIAREAQLEAYLTRPGFPAYDPKFKFTVDNVPKILHIGMKAAGSDLSLEDVQEMTFDAGFDVARDLAIEYLALTVSARPAHVPESSGGDDAG